SHVCQVGTRSQGVRMVYTKDMLDVAYQSSEQIPGGLGISCLSGPVSKAVAGAHGVWMLRAGNSFVCGQKSRKLVSGGSRIPRLPGPSGKAVPTGQRMRVLDAANPFEVS